MELNNQPVESYHGTDFNISEFVAHQITAILRRTMDEARAIASEKGNSKLKQPGHDGLADAPRSLTVSNTQTGKEQKSMLPLKRILCPTDYSEPSYIALEQASELAAHFGAELYVLHVVPTLSLEVEPGVYALQDSDVERLEVSRKKLQKIIAEHTPQNLPIHAVVRSGNAADEIVRAARQEEVDIIVIATHGLTGWRHLVFGSVTERVLRLIRCPILIIHPPQK